MDLTFDAPVSATTNAYEKTRSGKSRASRVPPKARTASIASASSFFDNLSNRVRNSFHHSSSSAPSNSTSKRSSPALQASNSLPAAESLFFRLPLELREAIYGLVVARRQTIHIMMKQRPQGRPRPLVHRLCQAGGDVKECVLHGCKRFLDVEDEQACYFGSFANVCGILYSSRDIFHEVSNLIYTQNTFDFDHIMTFRLFKQTLNPYSLNSIKSISLNLVIHWTSADWEETCVIISEMEGLEEIRFRFRHHEYARCPLPPLIILRPLLQISRPMRVFEVEFPWGKGWKLESRLADAPFKLV